MAQKTIHEVYTNFKAQQGGAFTLLHIGDFYETYDHDAEEASRILGIALAKRDDGTCVAGFPYHALYIYLPKIIRAGKRVCIVDKDVLDNALKENNKTTKPQNNNSTMATNNNIATENTNEVKNTISLLSYDAHFYYNPEAKALVHIEISKMCIDFDKCECRQYESSTGKDVQLTNEYRYYNSENDFRNDRPLATPFMEMDKQDALAERTHIGLVKREDGTKRAYILIFADGKPTRWYLDENIHIMWKTLTKEHGWDVDYDGVTIPKQYRSAEVLSLFNDYDVIAQDGTKHTHYGEAKPLLLNDKQQALWDEYVELTERMEAADISLFIDYENNKVMAVNNNGIEDWLCNDDSIDEETQVKITDGYEEFPSVSMRYMGYDDVLVVKKLNK